MTKKYDQGKTQADLILSRFAHALEAVSDVGTWAIQPPPAGKGYVPHSWLDVPNGIQRYKDASERHKLAIGKGELLDPESELPHLYHIAWNALAVLELTLREKLDAVGENGPELFVPRSAGDVTINLKVGEHTCREHPGGIKW